MERSSSFCNRDPRTMSTNELFASIQGTIEKVIQLVNKMEPDELERLLNGTTHRDEETKELHNQGEDTSCYEVQGNNANSCTSFGLKLHCVGSSQLSISNNLISCELNDSFPHCDNVFVESVHTLVDPIDDRIDSSCKINLCPPSVDTCALSDITLSCRSFPCFDNIPIENVDTLVDPIDDKINSSSKINLCSPSVDTCGLNASSLSSDIDRIVIPLEGYQVIENPLWYNDTLSKDGTLVLEDDSTSIGGVSGQKEEDCQPGKKCVLDPCSWISFHLMLVDQILLMLGQDDKHNLEEFVGTFPYDGKFFLRVHNPFEGPTLRMGNGSFLTPFLYYVFAYDLVDCASYGAMIMEDTWLFLEIESPWYKAFCANNYTNPLAMRTYWLLVLLMFLQGLDSKTNPFQEGEDDNVMDNKDHVKALEELDGHQIKTYNVLKVHPSEEKEESGHVCKWPSHEFKN
ncbi:hypothetical protein KY290_010848 [Solanum tuberosum]|uniref:Uncharacterized protein n=1 Tax=Solanum tuberosum TaxID=4113 RepID=A0ABQ7VYZ0_SOLTU|nr:hypothetical protein KY290_010848 [Solanum tuberosum]